MDAQIIVPTTGLLVLLRKISLCSYEHLVTSGFFPSFPFNLMPILHEIQLML